MFISLARMVLKRSEEEDAHTARLVRQEVVGSRNHSRKWQQLHRHHLKGGESRR